MNMGGESTAAWPQFLDDRDKRGLKRPQFVIVDGAPGLEVRGGPENSAGHCFPDDWLVALWGDDLPIQRCTVHKHRNLLVHAPNHMHEELGNDYRDMIHAATAAEVETRRKAFVRTWRLMCRAVADSLEESGDRHLPIKRLDPSHWTAARKTNAIDRLNGGFRRRIKTQAVLPCAQTVPMILWALLASGQITLRKVDVWQTFDKKIQPVTPDLAA